jgi:hypothetical protein
MWTEAEILEDESRRNKRMKKDKLAQPHVTLYADAYLRNGSFYFRYDVAVTAAYVVRQ